MICANNKNQGEPPPEEVSTSALEVLQGIPKEPPKNPEQLRDRVRRLASLSQETRELALAHVRALLPYRSASERILEYLRMFVGQEISGEELRIVSGISEYARRIREWRVEFGWPIKHEARSYTLLRNEPDAAKADLWRTLNEIKRSDRGARDKMLAVFRALPIGTPITTAQMRYVTEGKDMRRVRELRTQFGWRIVTKKTGLPNLKPDEYVLVDPNPVEEHDRNVELETVIEVLRRDGNRCRKCAWHPSERTQGDPRQYIELHHAEWHVEGGKNDARNLVTLCNVHHRKVHTLKLSKPDLMKWLATK